MRLEVPPEAISRCVVCSDSYISDAAGWPHPTDCPTCAKRRTAIFEIELDGQLCAKRVAIGGLGHADALAFARRWFQSLGYKVGPHNRKL